MANDVLVTVKGQLEKQLTEKFEALPKDFNKTRFTQNVLAVLNESKDLQLCTPQSIIIAVMKGAFLGLDFFRKEAYIIKYGNVATFQTDYKGERKLAKKYSINPIKDIYAKLVREGDKFSEKINNGIQTIDFEPIPFNDNKIVGAFAVVLFEDGSMLYETMSTQEIEDIRKNFSKAQNSKAWTATWGEMAKKVVLRRLMKSIEIDFESSEQDKAFIDSGDADFEKEKEVNNKPKSAFEKMIEEKEENVSEETGEIIENDITENFNPFESEVQ